MAHLPMGTVTFLFTDIEGSTTPIPAVVHSLVRLRGTERGTEQWAVYGHERPHACRNVPRALWRSCSGHAQ